ncbi:hypothetical protein HEP81_06524 [Streptomyces griseofuscus]|uniref:Uncharacterized protein n=1 Tax=Streptomyces griseofuscus TaxID=146922 RepID=A0A7H1Q8X9_9ACTN|nr:hypothetical protein HEP81_06524 [Streptomyces griseofuscus]
MNRGPVRRPTEVAALRAVARSARPLPPPAVLFAHLVVTDAARDRHGSNLLGHRIARAAGVLTELPE